MAQWMHKAEKNPRWAGDNIGKLGVHDWIEKEVGLAKNQTCSQLDATCKGRLEWSNKSQEYRRRLEDWWVLCTSHHRRFDNHINCREPWNKAHLKKSCGICARLFAIRPYQLEKRKHCSVECYRKAQRREI